MSTFIKGIYTFYGKLNIERKFDSNRIYTFYGKLGAVMAGEAGQPLGHCARLCATADHDDDDNDPSPLLLLLLYTHALLIER